MHHPWNLGAESFFFHDLGLIPPKPLYRTTTAHDFGLRKLNVKNDYSCNKCAEQNTYGTYRTNTVKNHFCLRTHLFKTLLIGHISNYS